MYSDSEVECLEPPSSRHHDALLFQVKDIVKKRDKKRLVCVRVLAFLFVFLFFLLFFSTVAPGRFGATGPLAPWQVRRSYGVLQPAFTAGLIPSKRLFLIFFFFFFNHRP